MAPDQVKLVQDSFKQVLPIAPQAADLFYNRLFEIAPEVRALFPSDMSGQKKKLMAMLATAVNGLDKIETIVPAVQGLGRRHVAYGVTPEHYKSVGEALIWTLEQGLGDGFTPNVKAAWLATYDTLQGVMIAAAGEVKVKSAASQARAKTSLWAKIFG